MIPALERSEADLLIVPGAGRLESRRRATYAAKVARKVGCHVLASGYKSNGHPESEAEYMREVMLRLGVDSSKMHIDNLASNTLQNVKLARTLVEALNVRRLGIVTGHFHMIRTAELARMFYPDREIVEYPLPIITPWDVFAEGLTGCLEHFSRKKTFSGIKRHLASGGTLDNYSGERMFYNRGEA